MDTKWKNDSSVIWSILALLIAVGSIVYCFSIVTLLFTNSWEYAMKMYSVIVRIIEGNLV